MTPVKPLRVKFILPALTEATSPYWRPIKYSLFPPLGLATLATIANSRTDDVMAGAAGNPAALPGALTEGFQSAFLAGAGFAALGIVLTLVLIRTKDSRAHVEVSRRQSLDRTAQAAAS